MTIRFKCPHCQKPLGVKEELAGKRAACPACKKPITIPAQIAQPADLDAFAAAALTEEPAAPKEDPAAKPVKFTCSFCAEEVEVPFEMAGKQHPCPECKRIVKIPLPKADKPKDWRDLAKKGPAAALINLPEQLDGAWGTEVKGRVSRASLEDAEAVPELLVKEPVGVGGWIKRVLVGGAVVGVVALLYVVANRSTTQRANKNALKEFEAYVAAKKADPKSDFSVLHEAAGQLAAGKLKLREDKREPARIEFARARSTALGGKDPPVDVDLFLLDLVLAQLELGGTEDQLLSKTRYEAKFVHKEIEQTLDKIKSNEAKVIIIRELAGVLVPRKEAPTVIAFAGGLNMAQADNVKLTPVLPQQVALQLAFFDVKKIDTKIEPRKEGKEIQYQTRLAYSEGHAWKRETSPANELVRLPGPSHQILEAGVGVASVLLLDQSNPDGAKQAAPFVHDALVLLQEKKVSASPWHILQLIRVASRTEHRERARPLIDSLSGPFKRRAQYEWLLARLEKGDGAAKDYLKDLPDKEGPNRGLAWIALGRHLAQRGAEIEPEEGDEDYRVFHMLGRALGNQDQH